MPVRIAVVGSLNMDLVVRTHRLPRPGETIIGESFHTAPGGKGANQAAAAAKLGAQVTMIGRVGDDSFGAQQVDGLSQLGVDTSWVRVDESAATGVASIAVDDRGQNAIVVAPGANMRLSPADVLAAEEAISSASALLLQLEVPLDVVEAAIEVASSHDVSVVLNPAPARELPLDLLSQVDVLVPNETEIELLAGFQVREIRDGLAAAQELLSDGVGTVVVTLGARGALAVNWTQRLHVPAFAVQVIDATAAGDAFVAAFAIARSEGQRLEQAVRFANAAGALAATKLGAQPSLPSRAELDSLLATH